MILDKFNSVLNTIHKTIILLKAFHNIISTFPFSVKYVFEDQKMQKNEQTQVTISLKNRLCP